MFVVFFYSLGETHLWHQLCNVMLLEIHVVVTMLSLSVLPSHSYLLHLRYCEEILQILLL